MALTISRIVYELNISRDAVHEDLNETKLLSEINEHMEILLDP